MHVLVLIKSIRRVVLASQDKFYRNAHLLKRAEDQSTILFVEFELSLKACQTVWIYFIILQVQADYMDLFEFVWNFRTSVLFCGELKLITSPRHVVLLQLLWPRDEFHRKDLLALRSHHHFDNALDVVRLLTSFCFHRYHWDIDIRVKLWRRLFCLNHSVLIKLF